MTSTRRRLSATATLLLVPTLAACGFGAQTNHQYQSAAGLDSIQVKDTSGNLLNAASPIQVYNAAIVVEPGNPDGVFVGTFVNNSADNPAQGYNATTGALKDPGIPATVSAMTLGSATATPVTLTLPSNGSYRPQPIGCGNGEYGLKVTVPAANVETATLAKGEYLPMTFAIVDGTGRQYTVTMPSVPVFPVTSTDFPNGGAGGVFDPYYSSNGSVPASECPTQTALPVQTSLWTGPAPLATPTGTATAPASPSATPTH
ncbi:MAG TPA: hypothetical protein VN108_08200 [Marmoricola sp.]|nr:hypothetical protein [Marmoricola sp.]